MKIQSTKSNGNTRFIGLATGSSGVGKTKLFSTIKDPCLLISAEAGALCLADCDIPMIDITKDEDGNPIPKELRIEELKKAYVYLLSDESRKKYKWIGIDSLTEISQNMIEALHKEFPDRRDSMILYGENFKRMRALIKAFRDLPYYNIVFTALTEESKDEHGRRVEEISMVGKMSQQIAGYMDEVFYLHITEDEDGNHVRRLLTQPTNRIVAKDRSGKLDKLEMPDLQYIYNKINGINY